MSATGYTPILIYASGTTSNVPLAANLTTTSTGAELALNYTDGKLYYKDNAGVVQLLASKASLNPSTVLSGTIQMWATGTAPTGYLLCNGLAVSRTTYATLFGILGTTFGVGDGSTTFNLPNYQDRMPIGVNTIAASVGATGGSATTTLTVSNLPSHSHSITDPTHTHAFTASVSSYGPRGGAGGEYWGAQPSGSTTSAASTGITATNTTGSGTAANTISPYLGIYFIIKT